MGYFRELRLGLRGCRPRFSFGLALFGRDGGLTGRVLLDLFGFYIFLCKWGRPPEELMESWGFTYHMRGIQFQWGRHCRIWYLPWALEHQKTETMRPDGSWVPLIASYESGDDGRLREIHPYTYKLKSGDALQQREAAVWAERREWRWRWFQWLPWPRIIRTSIWVEFDEEIGERVGTWKGGTVGCGWDLRPGEALGDALGRMERDRKFD